MARSRARSGRSCADYGRRVKERVLSLAKTSGAAVLPVSGRTRLIIEPPIGVASGHDRARALEEGLAQYARVLASYVTRYPAQYRGWHLLGRPGER